MMRQIDIDLLFQFAPWFFEGLVILEFNQNQNLVNLGDSTRY